MIGGLEVRVEGRRVTHLATWPPAAAKVLATTGGTPVLMLVGAAAGLLESDTLFIRLWLAAGSALEVRSVAATLAHPCAAGGATAVEVTGHVGPGAQLAWLAEPLVACARCRHRSHTRLLLAEGACVAWSELVTLGRSREVPGRVELRLDAEVGGRPLVRDGLRLGGDGPPGWDGPAVTGGHRHLATLHALGYRVAPGAPGAMQLAGPGSTARFLSDTGAGLRHQVDRALPYFLSPLGRQDRGAGCIDLPLCTQR